MDYLTIITVLLISIIILINSMMKSVSGRNKKLPPGPKPLPIIGNFHLLHRYAPHESFLQLAKVYGPIMFLRLGFKNAVVISSAAMAKQILQTQDLAFSSRTVPDAMRGYNHDKSSIGAIPVGPLWRKLRKILNLKIFSASSLDGNQHVRHQKLEELVEHCRESSRSGEAVDLSRASMKTALNMLSKTIFSKDLDSWKELKDPIRNIVEKVEGPNIADFIPFLRALDPQGLRRRISNYSRRVSELLNVLMDEKLELRKKGDVKDDNVIDILLTTIEKKTEEIDRTHIMSLSLDLIIAGTDTLASAVEWAMTEALRNPETTKRVKHELDQVIGKGNILKVEDVKRLPYLRCMVKESLRLHPPVPLLIPRKVEQDVEVCGYTVPKNSIVLVNAWAIGRDFFIPGQALLPDPNGTSSKSLPLTPNNILNASILS